MEYKVKTVSEKKKTSKGGFYYKVTLTDGEKDYPIVLFDKEIQLGDIVSGEMGRYKEKFKTYDFTIDHIEKTSKEEIPEKPKKENLTEKNLSEAQKQSYIIFESIFSSICNLNKVELPEAIATAWQIQRYLTTGKWELLCLPEQRKQIVAKYKSLEVARAIVYAKYSKPYLHLLTYKEAQEMLREG